MEFTTGLLGLNEARRRNLPYIPTQGMLFVPPGNTVVMTPGRPFVISWSDKEMLVAYTDRTETIDAMVEALQRRGACACDINICVEMHFPTQDEAFIEKARKIGIRHAWSMDSLEDFLARKNVGPADVELIAVTRGN